MFVIILVLFVGSVHAQSDFNPASYKKPMLNTIWEVSSEIRSVKTTAEPVFLGLGRSPAPMMAALESAGERVVHLPFSDGAIWEGQIRKGNLKTELEIYKSIKPHLEQTLRASISAKTEIILVDYAASGKSYSLGYRLIRRYLAENCPSCVLNGAVMTDNMDFVDLRLDHAMERGQASSKVKIVDLTKTPSRQHLANALARGDYKRIAPYGTFSIDQPPSAFPKKPNPDYAIFKAWIKSSVPIFPESVGSCAPPKGSLPPVRTPAGGSLAGLSNFLGAWAGFTGFLPSQNPYAKPEGLDCGESAEAMNQMRCKWDSKLNPLNDWVVCTRVKSFQVIPSASGAKVCSVQTQVVTFECSSSACKGDFNRGNLLGPLNQAQSDDEAYRWIEGLRKKYDVKPEVEERSFPEDVGTL